MGIDIFYKVRAERNQDGGLSISEKGLLRYITPNWKREKLRQTAEKDLLNHPEKTSVYATYVWDPKDRLQIMLVDRKTAQEIRLASEDF